MSDDIQSYHYYDYMLVISLTWSEVFFIQKLGCPYTEGVDDSWITEMIYKPGEPRIKLLQWLFSKCVKTLLLLLLLLLLWVQHLKSKQSSSFHLSKDRSQYYPSLHCNEYRYGNKLVLRFYVQLLYPGYILI